MSPMVGALATVAFLAAGVAYARRPRRPGFFAPWWSDLRESRQPDNTTRADLELLLNHWDPDEGTALRWSLEWCARNQRTTG